VRILNLDPDPLGARAIAVFDVELNPDIILRGMVLRRNEIGEVRCFPARLPYGHKRSVDIAPRLTREILKLALDAFAQQKRPAPDAAHHHA